MFTSICACVSQVLENEREAERRRRFSASLRATVTDAQAELARDQVLHRGWGDMPGGLRAGRLGG